MISFSFPQLFQMCYIPPSRARKINLFDQNSNNLGVFLIEK